MRYFIVFFITLFSVQLNAQNDSLVTKLQGTVYHAETRLPMNNVHIINTTRVIGTVSDGNGYFEINAKVNDTLLFSYLGFETIKLKVSNDWVKNKTSKIYLTERAYALEEIVVAQYNLTGFMEVDTKLIKVDENNYRYSISGLTEGYEAGDKSPGAVSKVLGAIFNPADFLYSAFGKRPRQMKKLREMKKDDTVRNLLAAKYDRETLAALLEISKDDIPLILQNCNYSEYFIKSANDLQIMDAISSCYEEFKILNKNR